jgi:predicted DNA-binding transcriptional regulator AlpA
MDSKLLPSAAVRRICGDISDMSLWRWLHDPKLAFPQPIMIQRRRYWREADVQAWIDQRTSKPYATSAT